ncbi:MAG: TolC family protein, partial [Verrucomicrobiales bacterium]|nr:TolC family protein [Verrucomicrobiales bacterium]
SSIYESRERVQNTQDFIATDRISLFEQENSLNQSSLQGRLITGATYELSLNANRLEDSLNARDVARFRPEYESDVLLRVTQPLLKDAGEGVTMTQVRIAKSELRVSRHDLQLKILTVVSQVMEAFIETLFAQENVAVKKDAIELAEKVRAENMRRVDLGVMKPLDVIQAEVAVSQAEEELISAETFLVQRQNTMKALIFKDFDHVMDLLVEADGVLSPDVPDMGDRLRYFRLAKKHNPEFLKQRELVGQEEIRYKFAKNQMLPRLDFQGSFGYNGLDEQFGGALNDYTSQGPDWSLGFVFSVPLGNRAAKAQMRESMLRRQQASLASRYTENGIGAAISTALNRVDANQRRVATTAKSVELATKALDAELKRLETGVGTSYDVLRTQDEVSAARTRRLAAVAELEKAVTQLWTAVGKIPQLEASVDVVLDGE